MAEIGANQRVGYSLLIQRCCWTFRLITAARNFFRLTFPAHWNWASRSALRARCMVYLRSNRAGNSC